jgi:hypothetical protein
MDYIELAWYIGVALGGFRLLSQFIIKMIAIFAGDKHSARAFEVLRITWAEHAMNRVRNQRERRPIRRNRDVG